MSLLLGCSQIGLQGSDEKYEHGKKIIEAVLESGNRVLDPVFGFLHRSGSRPDRESRSIESRSCPDIPIWFRRTDLSGPSCAFVVDAAARYGKQVEARLLDASSPPPSIDYIRASLHFSQSLIFSSSGVLGVWFGVFSDSCLGFVEFLSTEFRLYFSTGRVFEKAPPGGWFHSPWVNVVFRAVRTVQHRRALKACA
jgi:hypothetical protein